MTQLSGYIPLLQKFISFPSISTDEQFKTNINACADWLITLLSDAGFTTQKITGYGNPLVYGHYVVDAAYETILIYGHYDVQPASKDEGWQSDPFLLTERNGKIYARGAVDNKGQIMIHVATVLELIKKGQLAYNVKFLIEGDEETGSPHINQAMEDYKELLKADVALVSDGEMIGDHTPTMVLGFRGGCNMTMTLQTATTDLHSGIYGNVAMSASHEASKIIAKLYDENNLITIPGWYDDIRPISDEQTANNSLVPRNQEETLHMIGAKKLAVPTGYDAVTANGLLPTIQVSGITTGYTGNGYKNIIPGSATIKINFRFAPGQDPETKISQFSTWIKNTIADAFTFQLETSDPYKAIAIGTSHPLYEKTRALAKEVYGVIPVARYCGAAVPITGLFQDVLGMSVIIIDLGNEDCNMHGVDENFTISCIEKGLELSERLLGSKKYI